MAKTVTVYQKTGSKDQGFMYKGHLYPFSEEREDLEATARRVSQGYYSAFSDWEYIIDGVHMPTFVLGNVVQYDPTPIATFIFD